MTRGRKLYSDVPLNVYINDDNKIAPLAYVCVCGWECVCFSGNQPWQPGILIPDRPPPPTSRRAAPSLAITFPAVILQWNSMAPPGELGRYKPHYGKSIETNVTLDFANYGKEPRDGLRRNWKSMHRKLMDIISSTTNFTHINTYKHIVYILYTLYCIHSNFFKCSSILWTTH